MQARARLQGAGARACLQGAGARACLRQERDGSQALPPPLQVPDLDAGGRGGAQPVAVGREAQRVDDVARVQGVQALALRQVPQHRHVVLRVATTQQSGSGGQQWAVRQQRAAARAAARAQQRAVRECGRRTEQLQKLVHAAKATQALCAPGPARTPCLTSPPACPHPSHARPRARPPRPPSRAHLAARRAQRAIRGHGHGVHVALVAHQVVLELAVGQVPHLRPGAGARHARCRHVRAAGPAATRLAPLAQGRWGGVGQPGAAGHGACPLSLSLLRARAHAP